MTNNRKPKSPIICRCNNVSRATIEQAILDGSDSMIKIFDATSAGVGPCGGSCRRKLKPLLEYYLQTGTFPEKIIEDMTGKPTPNTDGENRINSETPAEAPSMEETNSSDATLKKSSDENR